MDIVARDITKIYGNKGNEIIIFEEANINIPSASFTGIFGVSGAGKTTLLNILSGIEPITAGKIIFDGWDLALAGEKERSDFRLSNIGFIFQNFNLIPSLTVVENVSLPLIAIRDKKEAAKMAEAALERVSIAQRAKNLPDTLSFGEKQRVSIARAIVNRPKIIFADEPVSNLEDRSAEKIIQILRDFNMKEKATVVLCTNHSELSRRKWDRFYNITGGNIKESWPTI